MRVGLIGTGLMGVQIANRLLAVGYDLYVHKAAVLDMRPYRRSL